MNANFWLAVLGLALVGGPVSAQPGQSNSPGTPLGLGAIGNNGILRPMWDPPGWGWDYPNYFDYGYGFTATERPYVGPQTKFTFFGGWSELGYAFAQVPVPPYMDVEPAFPVKGAPLPLKPAPVLKPGVASVTVRVPAGAQVWFNDVLVPPKAGAPWVFKSGPLEAGQKFPLQIKARWSVDGVDKNYDLILSLKAGDELSFDLR